MAKRTLKEKSGKPEEDKLQNELEDVIEQINQILKKHEIELSAVALSKKGKIIFTFTESNVFMAAKLSAEMTNAIAEIVNKSIARGIRS